MFTINTHNMTSIGSFERAKSYFESTPRPRSKKWQEHQRPLDDVRATQKRIEKNADGSYGLWLYRTELIRYYAPDEDGFARVLVAYHPSQSSKAFVYRHYDGYPYFKFTRHDTGEEIWVPVSSNAFHNDDYWSVDLMVKRSVIDVSRSWHIPVGVRCTSKERKAERRDACKPVEHLLNFAVKTAEPDAWRPRKHLDRRTAEAAVQGSPDAQQALLQWAISYNSTSPATLKNALLQELHLYTGDDVKPLPMFPSVDLLPGYRSLRNLRTISQ